MCLNRGYIILKVLGLRTEVSMSPEGCMYLIIIHLGPKGGLGFRV